MLHARVDAGRAAPQLEAAAPVLVALSTQLTARAMLPTTPSAPVHARLQPLQLATPHLNEAHTPVLHASTVAPFAAVHALSTLEEPSELWHVARRRHWPPPHCTEHSPHTEYRHL